MMRKYYYIFIINPIIIFFCINGCKTQSVSKESLSGVFCYRADKADFNFDYVLKLKRDSFALHIDKQYCTGKWVPTSQKDQIKLICIDSKDSIAESLSSSYLKDREYLIKLVDKNTLELIIYEMDFPIPKRKERIILLERK